MTNSTDFKQSFWWSSLSEFGEEVLIKNRKKIKFSQQEAAAKLGLNQSEVSRIERGLVKAKSIILTTEICNLYELSPSQRKKYLELTSGLPIIEPNIIDGLLENQIKSIAHLNRSGFPILAIKQSENLRSWIESNTDLGNSNNLFTVAKVTHLLLEESAAWWDIVLPSEIHNHTDNLIKRMETFTSTNKNHSFYIETYIKINKGFHAYINNDYQEAITYFNNILQFTDKIDSLWHLEVFRATLIILGKLKDYNALQEAESKAYEYIHNTSINHLSRGYLLEGLTRAYAEFDVTKSLVFFDLANKHLAKARKEPDFLNIRNIQLTRTLLNTLKLQRTDHHKLLKLAQPALNEASKCGFTRHREQIISLINS